MFDVTLVDLNRYWNTACAKSYDNIVPATNAVVTITDILESQCPRNLLLVWTPNGYFLTIFINKLACFNKLLNKKNSIKTFRTRVTSHETNSGILHLHIRSHVRIVQPNIFKTAMWYNKIIVENVTGSCNERVREPDRVLNTTWWKTGA